MSRQHCISIRIVNIDHYLAEPGPFDRRFTPYSETPLDKVPVIRIFGSTPSGQKTCLHIHQAYPYFYVPYKTSSIDPEDIQRDIYQFGAALNQAIALSKTTAKKDASDQQYIAAITLVKGVPFYGFHTGYQMFLKIHLLNPSDKQRMLDLLQSGAIRETIFQPHEAHISFELQFMMDYNLFGMDWIHIDSIQDNDPQLSLRFRQPLMDEPKTHVILSQHSSNEERGDVQYYTARSIPAELQWAEVPRSSYCELEADTTAMTIANRLEVKQRNIHDNEHTGSVLHERPFDPSEKLIPSLACIWTDEDKRRQSKGENMPSFASQSSDQRVPDIKWDMEHRWRRMLDRYIASDQTVPAINNDIALACPEVQAPSSMAVDMSHIPSAFEAVEALYPDSYFRHGNILPQSLFRQRTSSDEHLFSDFGSPFNIPTTTTRNQQEMLLQAQHSVDEDKIRSLLESQSFHDDGEGGGGMDDDDLLAMLDEFENREDMDDAQQMENDFLEEPDAAGSSTDRLFRPRKLDFSIHAAQTTEEDEDDHQLMVSDIPPSPPLRHKRNRLYLPQFDGAGDSDDTESNDNDTNFEKAWSKVKHRIKNSKRSWDFVNEPIVEIKHDAALLNFIASKSQESIPSSCSPPRASHHSTSSSSSSKTRTTCSPSRDMKRQKIDDLREEYVFAPPPPVVTTERVQYQEPYYSNPADVPNKPKVFSGKEFRLKSKSLCDLKPVQGRFSHDHSMAKSSTHIKFWEPLDPPPTFQQVKHWLQDKSSHCKEDDTRPKNIEQSQLDGPSKLNSFDFQFSLTKPKGKVSSTRNYLDLLSLEVHVNTRDDKLPDPAHDPIQVIFWCLQTEDVNIASNGFQEGYHVGIIAVGDKVKVSKIGLYDIDTTYVENEYELLLTLIDKVRLYDPDFLVGYELNNSSWGYVIERAAQLKINLIDELARILASSDTLQRDHWGYRKASVFRTSGRHMVNVWRIMRGELNLTSYTFENIAYQLLHCRVPHFSHRTLTTWYKAGAPVLKHRLFRYYLDRVQMNLDMLDVSECINRTSESARVFGIDFYSVITRGSQFKVESMMFRLAKPENFILVTPSRKQVGQQRAAECLPLIMEPETKYYNSPLLVLDFQSLYPSVMIAYNYCFSTCLGKVRAPDDPPRFGVSELDVPPEILDQLKDEINISPNGIMFVKPSVRKSLLAKMLQEILDTRVMVKASMKEYKDDKGLQRLLDARQLTLKYIANVTYGYTAATFSGRMPAVEIADSIVQTGRETLEKTIATITQSEKWDARVVYGDTDSVFVYLPGRTREEAFVIGNEIADTITSMNPAPIRLKFEKVYHPCVLVAKKRYVGFKFEHPDQEEPEFEAKGIETVRRDGTPATQKILESGLKILFRTQDMSELKDYLKRQWTKILSNRVPLQDFIIAKEVKLGSYTEQGKPNGARVAEAQMALDPRAAPQYGERVPYVVVHKGPNARLRDKVVRPEEIISDNSLMLDGEYYIRKQIIPPLARIFNLVGVDIAAWYDEMPKQQKVSAIASSHYAQHEAQTARRIDQYYASSHCVVCRRLTRNAICDACQAKYANTVYILRSRQAESQTRIADILKVCDTCSQVSSTINAPTDDRAAIGNTGFADHPCDSLDCPVFYERVKAKNDIRATTTYDELLDK